MKNTSRFWIILILAAIFLVGCQANPNDKKTTIQAQEMNKIGFVITTDKGVMEGVLYPDVAPNTVLNFVKLTQSGFYNGLNFHRVVPGFVIQGGDPKGDGTGGPGYSIPAEFNKKPHKVGALAMARSQHPDSAGSQFYICIGAESVKQLDGKYTVFGQVTKGVSVAHKIGVGDKIKSIKITGKLPKSLQGKDIKKSGNR